MLLLRYNIRKLSGQINYEKIYYKQLKEFYEKKKPYYSKECLIKNNISNKFYTHKDLNNNSDLTKINTYKKNIKYQY